MPILPTTPPPETPDNSPKGAPQFPDGEVDQFLQRRVCARCYGDLQKVPAPERMWNVICPTCGDAWNFATVSRSYAEALGQIALDQSWEVRRNLPDLFPNPHQGKSATQILRELGF